ncbi:PqqD family protein [Erythrobacter sp.]|jgi:uncharacterized protein YbjT (DUF2867 family)|uniref:PqqD family protein n=1 Tax=Erythrobacter sp. TaxID=1042 RepID=UPI002E98B461|nr:PqqD family protein [Erythrobacter sp.]
MSARVAGERFKISSEVVARELGGEAVLLDLESGQYFGLDPVGSRIWTLLAQTPLTLAELADRIEEEFDAPRARIESDLEALIADLQAQGLIVTSAAAS